MDTVKLPTRQKQAALRLLKERETVLEKIKQYEERIAENYAPCKVGDEVTVAGWSHRGKTMRVAELTCRVSNCFYGGAEISIKARGNVLNKDGQPGKQMAENEWRVTFNEAEIEAKADSGDSA